MTRLRREFLIRSAAVSVTFVDPSWMYSAPVPKERREGENAKLITPAARKAAEEGLRFLAENQSADGSFGSRSYQGNIGITSLAALAFVAAGNRPDDRAGGLVLRKALGFVLSKEKRDGSQDGYLHNPKRELFVPTGMYDHAFGTSFLAHLHGKVKEEKQAAELDAALGRAVKLILSSQNEEGGWRYTPTSKDADLSQTACQMMALAAARQAGVKIPKKTTDAGVNYIKKCFDPETGSFRYIAGKQQPNNHAFARTAAAVAVLQAHGIHGGNEVDKALSFVVKNRPTTGPRAYFHFFYGHYYAAMALRGSQDETWNKWYSTVSKELVASQERNGCWRDSVNLLHYATAMACIVLLAPEGRLALTTEPKPKE